MGEFGCDAGAVMAVFLQHCLICEHCSCLSGFQSWKATVVQSILLHQSLLHVIFVELGNLAVHLSLCNKSLLSTKRKE